MKHGGRSEALCGVFGRRMLRIITFRSSHDLQPDRLPISFPFRTKFLQFCIRGNSIPKHSAQIVAVVIVN
eukprot:6026930-Amphidinium_carterae.1